MNFIWNLAGSTHPDKEGRQHMLEEEHEEEHRVPWDVSNHH
jgi:hypothetical protein